MAKVKRETHGSKASYLSEYDKFSQSIKKSYPNASLESNSDLELSIPKSKLHPPVNINISAERQFQAMLLINNYFHVGFARFGFLKYFG